MELYVLQILESMTGSLEDNPYNVFLIWIVIAIMAFLVRTWVRSKGKTSVHAADETMDDIATSWIASKLDTGSQKIFGGAETLRPTWGASLFIPMLGLILVSAIDVQSYDLQRWNISEAEITFSSQFVYVIQVAALVGLPIYCLHALFVQRVVVEGTSITSHGFSLRPQERDLRNLSHVEVHGRRKLLKLSFRNERPIYVPHYLSSRETFLTALNEQIDENAHAHI